MVHKPLDKVGKKGENDYNQHFLIFPQSFLHNTEAKLDCNNFEFFACRLFKSGVKNSSLWKG